MTRPRAPRVLERGTSGTLECVKTEETHVPVREPEGLDVRDAAKGLGEVKDELWVVVGMLSVRAHNVTHGRECATPRRAAVREKAVRFKDVKDLILCRDCRWDDVSVKSWPGPGGEPTSARKVGRALVALRAFEASPTARSAAELCRDVSALDNIPSTKKAAALAQRRAVDLLLDDDGLPVLRRELARAAVQDVSVPSHLHGGAGARSTAILAELQDALVAELSEDTGWALVHSAGTTHRGLLRAVFGAGSVLGTHVALTLAPTIAVKVAATTSWHGRVEVVKFPTRPSAELVEAVAVLLDPQSAAEVATLAGAVAVASALL